MVSKNKLWSGSCRSVLLLLVGLVISYQSFGAQPTASGLRQKISFYRTQGLYDSVLYTFKGLEQLHRSRNESCELMRTLIDFAEFYRAIGRVEPAKPLIQEAEKIFDENPKCSKYAAVLYNRCAAIAQEGGLGGVAVMNYSLKAIAVAKETGDSLILGRSYNEIGMHYWATPGLSDSASFFFNRAYQVFSEMRDTAVMIEAVTNIVRFYYSREKFDTVISLSNMVLNTFTRFLTLESTAYFNANLFESYRKIGDYNNGLEAALRFHVATLQGRERAFNDDMAKAEARLKVITKEKQIEEQGQLLKLQKYQLSLYLVLAILAIIIGVVGFVSYRETRKKNKRLSQLLAENNLLTAELNHRVKNNFQLIVNIINHELRMEDADVFSRLSAVGKKIEALSALHKQLYNHADKMDVSLKPYILDITDNFEPILNTLKIQTEVAIDEISIEEKTASYIGLLVTELITNSLKHAFGSCESPKISLSVHKTVEGVVIDFRDNGKGLESNVVPTMVTILSQQIKASCEVNGYHGFSAKIKLPC